MEFNEIIENLTVWVQENICDGVELLKPSDTNMLEDYELVTPAAFALYVPPKDQLPPDVDQQIPSVCVQLKEGTDSLDTNNRSLSIRLAFSAYRPGHYTELTDDEGVTTLHFVRDAEGWKDLWLWVSKAINKIYTGMYIEGLRVDRKTPVKYGPFQIDDTLVEAYPMFYAWIDFTVTCGISPKSNNYNDLL